MEFNFTGKHALVTGVGKGIGRCVARALYEAGAIVHGISRTQSDLDTLEEECAGIKTICLDLRDWDATRKAVSSLEDIDILVNNAGINCPIKFLDVCKANYDSVYETNVKAVLNVSQVLVKKMIQRKVGGKIVNVSSEVSRLGYSSVYSSSKAALDQITRCMAVELGQHQIRVNSVHPNFVLETAMWKHAVLARSEELKQAMNRIPMGRFPEIEDVVNTILFLLSDKSDMINGALVPVEGGSWCT